MEKIKNIWRGLDGKKTFIGGVIAAVYLIGIDHQLWVQSELIEALIQFVFGLGVVHKAGKYIKRTS